MEVLVSTNDNIDEDTTTYKEFFIDSPEFRQEDEDRKGMLNWLTGKYNRLVTATATPNDFWSRRKYQEYVNPHFYAACYRAYRGEHIDSLINLYQAYLHGFNDVKLLNAELGEGGCLKELHEMDISTTLLSNNVYHEVQSCRQLVAKIRLRAAHIEKLPDFKKPS